MSSEASNRRGLMLVISSPSGAGKTTLSRMLMERYPEIVLSVSATTRDPRPGEEDGVHYHFVDHAKFEGCKIRKYPGNSEQPCTTPTWF